TQRNLSPKGREDARAIGRAFHDLGIPVGRVLASPMCRTEETARLIFGQSEPSTAVRGNVEFPSSDPRRFEQLRTIFVSPVPMGTKCRKRFIALNRYRGMHPATLDGD